MNLSGVGEKTERKLKKIGILKAEDFLQYYPNHYEYFPYLTYIKDLAHLEEGTVVSIWVQLPVSGGKIPAETSISLGFIRLIPFVS